MMIALATMPSLAGHHAALAGDAGAQGPDMLDNSLLTLGLVEAMQYSATHGNPAVRCITGQR